MICINQSLSAQDLHIFYDIQSEQIEYEYDGEKINKPQAKKDQNIFLHVNNYNNYLYDVEVKVNQRNILIPSSVGANPLSGMLSGKGKMPSLHLLSSSGTLAQDPLSLINESLQSEEDSNMGFAKNNSSASSALTALQVQFNSALSTIQKAESELLQVGNEINQELEAQKIYGMVTNELEKLKRNPELKPELIKKLCDEYLQKVFNVKRIEEIDLSYVLERSDYELLMKKHLANLNSKKKSYKNEVGKLESIDIKLGLLGLTDNTFTSLKSKIEDTYQRSEEVLENAETDQSTIVALIAESIEKDIQYLADLRYEYEAIISNDFSHTFRTSANGDFINFEIRLLEKENSSEAKAIRKAPIEVPVYGGFKIKSSIGLSFGAYGKATEEYYIRDAKIFSDEKSDFFPLITSFVHFYSQSKSNISIGGSLGLGIPLSGGNNISSLSFLVGPSLVIGKTSRVVISGGLMGGQVKRLAQGYEVGDSFISQADLVPTKNQYETGYFFGISYNIGS